MWKPITEAPKDGTEILIKGGTVRDTSETFPQDGLMRGVALVRWNQTYQIWRGEQTEAYDEFEVHTPTHFIAIGDLLKLPEKGALEHAETCRDHECGNGLEGRLV